jgi:hypothetical protein
MAVITNNPTFNRSTQNGYVPGYYTRTLFSYISASPFNTNGEWDFTTPDYNGIQYLIDNYPGDCHGDYRLPSHYWRPGKSIRVKGSLMVYGINDILLAYQQCYLNMLFGIYSFDADNTLVLAQQNDSAFHTFIEGSGELGLLPIEFQCTITCPYINPAADPSLYFQAQGYYKYTRDNYNSEGDNSNNRYVPVWNSYNNGFISTSDSQFYTGQTGIIFNFFTGELTYPDHVPNNLYITNLTIEELA